MPKKTKSKRLYFTKETEKAIVEYASTDDINRRTTLYIEEIQPALNELVDKIVYTYKFTSLENIDTLKEDCKLWLTTILDKFNADRGTKAYSYYSVVTKNWFTHQAKKQSKKNRREVQYDSIALKLESSKVDEDTDISNEIEDRQFWLFLMQEIDSWETEDLRENERKVLGAIRTLFTNIDKIQIFNKKAIYLYMREITGLNTKQVVGGLKRLRAKYREFNKKWNEGEV
jgi:hypothetical protein|tara:strand:+ start:2718 stop:3404 length:687 start_codon:yes stop_codon:yes gene_type:complete